MSIVCLRVEIVSNAVETQDCTPLDTLFSRPLFTEASLLVVDVALVHPRYHLTADRLIASRLLHQSLRSPARSRDDRQRVHLRVEHTSEDTLAEETCGQWREESTSSQSLAPTLVPTCEKPPVS